MGARELFPRDFFTDYWNPALRDELFVAMPFASQFDELWETAIAPAASACGLRAFRVDVRKSSDSIMVDILDSIAHARLILVDLSPVSCPPSPTRFSSLFRPSQQAIYPNGNVMYELGIAHAARQAEEVILIRNDRGQSLLFDVSGVRVHTYPASDIGATASLIEELTRDALRAVDLTKSLQVKRAVKAITVNEIKLIRMWYPYPFDLLAKDPDDGLKGIPGALNSAVECLQRLGVLESGPTASTDCFSTTLTWTPFGKAVVRALGPSIFAGRPDPLTRALKEKTSGDSAAAADGGDESNA